MELMLQMHPKANYFSKMKIHISHPCHQNWNEMTPNGDGKHCFSCSKTVVDFTGMNSIAIAVYLELHAQESVCGRFKKTQINEAPLDAQKFVDYVAKSRLPFLKKIAALFVFTFLLAMPPNPARAQQPQPKILRAPAPLKQKHTMGKIAVPKAQDSMKKFSTKNISARREHSPETQKKGNQDYQIMGMIALPVAQPNNTKPKNN